MRLILLILLLSFNNYSFATIYKCKSNNRKVTYANSPCSSKPTIVDLDQYESVIDSSLIRKKIQREKNQSTNQEVEEYESSDKNLITPHDIDIRLREIAIDMNDQISFPEKREDASTEYQLLKGKHA